MMRARHRSCSKRLFWTPEGKVPIRSLWSVCLMVSLPPPPWFWGDLIFQEGGFHGGTCDSEKKVGDLCILGGPNDLLANSGGTYLSIRQKLFMCLVASNHPIIPHPLWLWLYLVFKEPITKKFACGAYYISLLRIHCHRTISMSKCY